MDRDAFDGLTKLLAETPSRRAALGALLGSGLSGMFGAVGVARRDRDKRRKAGRKGRAQVSAQAADCSSPRPGTNISGCNYTGDDFSGQNLSSSRMVDTIFRDANLTGANLSSSNAKGANFRGADLCGANLRSSTLRNADFRGMSAANPTNLTLADLSSSACGGIRFDDDTVFCGTRDCNGTLRNDDCPGGPPANACCARATCDSLGLDCGTADDGCGGNLTCGVCPLGSTPVCDEGACATCPAACPGCFRCVGLIDGDTQCGNSIRVPCPASPASRCSSPADCTDPTFPICLLSDTIPSLGLTRTASQVAFDSCGTTSIPAGVGICVSVNPC